VAKSKRGICLPDRLHDVFISPMKSPEAHPAHPAHPAHSAFSIRPVAVLLMAGFLACLFAGMGCVDSSSSSSDFIRNVSVDYTGIYTGTGDNLVSQNSGEPINTLNLVQSGSGLEAFDNNGNLWRGDLSRVNADSSSSFRLDGQTTSGVAAQIVGTLSGEDTTGSMTGTYIEDGVFGIVSATADIAEVTTNTATGALSISPTGDQTLTTGETRQFTASGGGNAANSIMWTLSNNGIGRLSSTTGTTVTYTAAGAGTQTITATIGTQTDSTSISQSGSNLGLNNGLNNGLNGINAGGLQF